MQLTKENLFFQTVRKLFAILTKKQKVKSMFLLGFISVNSILDVFSLVSILPVLRIAQDTSIIHSNEYLSAVYNRLNFSSENDFLMAILVTVFAVFIVKNIAGIFINYLQSKFGFDLMVEISVKLYHRYMAKPLLYFKEENSAILHRNITNHPDTLAAGVILPVLLIVSEFLVMSIITVGIAIYNFKVFVLLLFVLAPTFLFLYSKSKNRLKFYGEQGNLIRPGLMRNVLQSIIGIVDVKLHQKENYFIRKYNALIGTLAHYRALQRTLTLAPPKITELTAFFGLVILFGFVLYYLDIKELFGLIILFVLSIYRVMPCGNRILNAMMSLKSNNYALDAIYELNWTAESEKGEELKDMNDLEPLSFNETIELRHIHFRYPGKDVPALDDVSLIFKKGDRIGIFGESGSGKTTLINVLLAFYECQQGDILVDGKVLDEDSVDAWRMILGYVQQDVFILDASMLENIAFGEDREDIDTDKVKSVLKIACLEDMVSELPDGVDTRIGEAGSLISGGQKQRVGIARALYKNAQLLFFDEATSALDTSTEKEITHAIDNLSKNEITSVIIAHRISTLKNCDQIYEMSEGKIKGPYSYDQVMKSEMDIT